MCFVSWFDEDIVVWSNVEILSSLNGCNLKKHLDTGPSCESMLRVPPDSSAEMELLSSLAESSIPLIFVFVSDEEMFAGVAGTEDLHVR